MKGCVPAAQEFLCTILARIRGMDDHDLPAEEEDDSPAGYAAAHARDAYENHRGHRALFRIDDWVVLYDAMPYPNEPSRRERELDELRAWLRGEGITELAFAEYPPAGAETGFAYAMVLDTPRDVDVHAALMQFLGAHDGGVAECRMCATQRSES